MIPKVDMRDTEKEIEEILEDAMRHCDDPTYEYIKRFSTLITKIRRGELKTIRSKLINTIGMDKSPTKLLAYLDSKIESLKGGD